jgi:hypothetical protein
MKPPISYPIFSQEDEIRDFYILGFWWSSKSNSTMTPNKRREEYMNQQQKKWIKLVLVITCIILMSHSVEYKDFEHNSWFLVARRPRPFHVSSCKLMRNIKVIQHIHGKEHITDKLQTKSLEFNLWIHWFRRRDSLTFDNKPPFH